MALSVVGIEDQISDHCSGSFSVSYRRVLSIGGFVPLVDCAVALKMLHFIGVKLGISECRSRNARFFPKGCNDGD